MSGVIVLRNGFDWAGSGWEFRAILTELLSELDRCADSEIVRILENPSGVAQVVGLIDLTDSSTWKTSHADRLEEALQKAYHRIKENGIWRTKIASDEKKRVILETMERICRNETRHQTG